MSSLVDKISKFDGLSSLISVIKRRIIYSSKRNKIKSHQKTFRKPQRGEIAVKPSCSEKKGNLKVSFFYVSISFFF